MIGAGPVGSNTAALIAESGYEVALVDKRPAGKRLVGCGCLVTPRVLDIVDAAADVIGWVHGAEIYSPSGKRMVIDGRETKGVVLDRARFDERILLRAIKSGAKSFLGRAAKAARYVEGGVRVSLAGDSGPERLTCRILIGADGATGTVAEWFSINRPKKMLLGCEQIMEGVTGDQGFAKLFVGREFAPGFFGWIIPGGETSRAGLCVEGGNVRASLNKMLTQTPAREFVGQARLVHYSTGRIPIGFPRRTYAPNVMVVGDAACQVKATSGGGIFTGLLCSTHCARTAVEALEKDDFSVAQLRTYHRSWTSEIGRELRRDLAIHEAFARLGDRHLEEIFDLMNKPSIIELVEKLGDIDFPSGAGWALVRREPRLLKYAGKALRSMLPRVR